MTTVAVPAASSLRTSDRLMRPAVVGAAGALAALLTAAGIGVDGVADPDAWSLVRGAVVAAYIAVGAYTWARRPSSRFGALVVGVGLLYTVASLTASHEPVVHTVGRVFHAGFVVYLAYAFLCFPGDHLGTRLERRLIEVFALATATVWLVALPVVETLPVGGPLVDCGAGCPDNAFRVTSVPDPLSSALELAVSGVTAGILVVVIAVLVSKASSPARLRRRLVGPVLVASVGLVVAYSLYTVLRDAGAAELDALRVFGVVAGLAVPAALLVGQVRGRVFAATTLVELVARVGGEQVTAAGVQTLLREALGDEELVVALRAPGGTGYVDVAGRPFELPSGRRDVGVTPVTRNGRPVAVLVHDATLDERSGVAEGLAATALMLLENAQLVEDLRASRARIVESEQRERLRLERNLHDGAQQRLFGIQLKLTAARARSRDPELARALDELRADAAETVDELRTLAHGLYPTVLRERGLADALRAAARTAPLPVRVLDRGVGRCAPTVEEAVYYCVLESIQNAAKHAGPAARVAVVLERANDELRFTVSDDGSGFRPGGDGDGIGLVSLRDRVGAVGGGIEVSSAPGHGTAVVGVVPAEPATSAGD
ncbi:MAG: sensor histidine kinase [Pseudomonadota bacterium]